MNTNTTRSQNQKNTKETNMSDHYNNPEANDEREKRMGLFWSHKPNAPWYKIIGGELCGLLAIPFLLVGVVFMLCFGRIIIGGWFLFEIIRVNCFNK